MKRIIMILFLIGSIACSHKERKVYVYKPIPISIPAEPYCAEEFLSVRFFKLKDFYCLDLNNALNLIANTEELKDCLDLYKKWASEVNKRIKKETIINSGGKDDRQRSEKD